jgi:hypothetical protein
MSRGLRFLDLVFGVAYCNLDLFQELHHVALNQLTSFPGRSQHGRILHTICAEPTCPILHPDLADRTSQAAYALACAWHPDAGDGQGSCAGQCFRHEDFLLVMAMGPRCARIRQKFEVTFGSKLFFTFIVV